MRLLSSLPPFLSSPCTCTCSTCRVYADSAQEQTLPPPPKSLKSGTTHHVMSACASSSLFPLYPYTLVGLILWKKQTLPPSSTILFVHLYSLVLLSMQEPLSPLTHDCLHTTVGCDTAHAATPTFYSLLLLYMYSLHLIYVSIATTSVSSPHSSTLS